jgi:tetrahydromethanopterin S-methyltransferase subunit G
MVATEYPEGVTPDANQLDRIETKVDIVETKVDIVKAEVAVVVARVSKLEGKSGFWGAVGGAAVMVFTRLAGCA